MGAGDVSDGVPSHQRSRRITLLPNCSLSPQGAVVFFGSVAFGSLTVAAFFVASGYWPILPFAGLELGVLGWALAVSLRRRQWTQTIDISDTDVVVETRGPQGCARDEFSRYWATVSRDRARGWHASRLWVGSHGRRREVGAFLTEEEREALYRRLRGLIGRTGAGSGS